VGPHIGAGNGIGAFKHNAAYSGCQDQNGGDPGQRVFAADEQAKSSFHKNLRSIFFAGDLF
jgi:hypothetical protein